MTPTARVSVNDERVNLCGVVAAVDSDATCNNHALELEAALSIQALLGFDESDARIIFVHLPLLSACLMKMTLSGTIDASELGAALKAMGHNVHEDEIQKMILQVSFVVEYYCYQLCSHQYQ